MKRRTKTSIAGAASVVLLFIPLWKVSTPFRMKQQFEVQARRQLKGAQSDAPFGAPFHKIEVHSFRYNWSGYYEARYNVWWDEGADSWKRTAFCRLDPVGRSYRNNCPIPEGARLNSETTFEIAVHE